MEDGLLRPSQAWITNVTAGSPFPNSRDNPMQYKF